ncbi:methyl-accepting chemotaxis protein [Desulfotomaculum sp. 1211_IL3151]|uniref:methyl-accepting chemotaxis protein n=1 Tax=Desulfotomaculum sp. 1211_IL3151 TaxID=3084055 RepID=UPI002FDA38AD
MKWLNNFKIGTKLLAVFTFVTFFTAILGYIAVYNLNQIKQRDFELYQVNTQPLSEICVAAISFQRIRVCLRDIVNTHDAKYRDAIYELDGKINDELAKLEKTMDAKEVSQKLTEVRANIEKFNVIRDQIIDHALNKKDAEAMESIYHGDGYRLAQNIDADLQKIMDIKVTQAKEKSEANILNANTAERNMILTILLGLGVSLGLGIMITKNIQKPLKQVVEVAERISNRDITVDVSMEDRRDELGHLLRTINQMSTNLREEIGKVATGVEVLVVSAGEISASTSQFVTGAHETASAVSETTTTMEEVKQTAQLSNEKAQYVSQIAQKAVHVSQNGQRSVDETVQGMNRIKEKMELIAEGIIRLSEQSQAIGEIISTVDDLAEQSNLLAVNASIEAAKAGDQGIGFVVVAQEIKSMAEQSKQATSQVRSILNEIQKATSSAVMATEQGYKVVEDGVKQSAEAGESIKIMTKTISEAAQSVVQIAASVQQQFVGMDQVALAMESIQQASGQNADGARQLELTAQSLAEMGRELRQLVQSYKL